MTRDPGDEKPVPRPQTIVTDATRAVSSLLKLALRAPSCFEPFVFVRYVGGELVEVSFPLDRHVVDRLAAFVAGDPPSDEEIERASAVVAPVARAEAEVIAEAKAWRRSASLLAQINLDKAVDRLLAAEKRRGEG